MNVNILLDNAQKVCGVHSDNALSKVLGVSRQAVSRWRLGLANPDEITCAKLSDMTGIQLSRVLGIVGEQRAISKEAKAVWRRLASAAVVLLLVGVPQARSASVLSVDSRSVASINAEPTTIYALCEVVMQCITGFARKCGAVFRSAGHVRPTTLLA
jgi:transcriptional regulator with XRE-family HTH domain